MTTLEKGTLGVPSPASSRIERDERHIVDFDGPGDAYNPINWTFCKKVYTSLLYSLTSVGSVWPSTAFAPANTEVANEFGVSAEVALLGTSLLLLGWAFGPLIWAPMSEVYGRKWPVLLPFLLSMVFSFATATAKDIQTVLITRFFTGFFGSAPITCTGGVFVDLWDASHRGTAIVGYTFCVCAIPSVVPLSFLEWVGGGPNISRVTGIMQVTILVLDNIILEETYVPTLLSVKASQLRKRTGDWALHTASEEHNTLIKDLAIKFGLRPLQMLATPICLFITIYSSFIYGVFYASLASFPILFQETRGWNDVVDSLPFLAISIGVFLGAMLNIWNQSYYLRAYEANNFKSEPEARLPPMMIASVVLAPGLFIMGWTSSPGIPWVATMIGTVMMGFRYYVIFTAAVNYLVDTFQRWGASALAANTFVRSVFAAALPMAVPYMYSSLGNGWAFSVLGFFALLNIPILFVFWIYGPRIRSMGKYTSNMG
ncbi:hypothetical protein MMC17_004630 [Xylographa soralifera]|nr:hypothetical protein [Xylographa soralifera]